jgi:transposase-like protein
MLFAKVIRQWLSPLFCPHENRVLDGIVREPITYARQASYYCPECQRNWVSWNLPDSVAR